MTLVVVATMTPKPGKLQDLVDAFEQVTETIQSEPGCEMYAVYTDEEVLVTIERWTDEAALDTHLHGDAVKQLLAAGGDILAREPEIRPLQSRGFGDPEKGVLQ